MTTRVTQKEKTLNWLRTQGDLTFIDAVNILHIMDVRKRIQALREDGYKILTVEKKNGSGRKFKAYRLIEEA